MGTTPLKKYDDCYAIVQRIDKHIKKVHKS